MAQMREVLDTVEKEGSDFLGEIRPGLYSDEVFRLHPQGRSAATARRSHTARLRL
ncbi:MAG: hypothetical protein MZV63_22650 [Marinilabiliales bacterium]|nr:hypothetical protein [Marinilabiliales bacterium]